MEITLWQQEAVVQLRSPMRQPIYGRQSSMIYRFRLHLVVGRSHHNSLDEHRLQVAFAESYIPKHSTAK